VIRFTTMTAPLFAAIDGLEFRHQQWTAVGAAALSTEQRDQIIKYTGRILGVHPDDEGAFAEFVAGAAAEPPPAPVAASTPTEQTSPPTPSAQAEQTTPDQAKAKPKR